MHSSRREMILRQDFWSGTFGKRRMLRAGNRVTVEERVIQRYGEPRTIFVLIDGTAYMLVAREMLAEVGEQIELPPKQDLEQLGLF